MRSSLYASFFFAYIEYSPDLRLSAIMNVFSGNYIEIISAS